MTPVRTGPRPTTSGPSPSISVAWPDSHTADVRDRVVDTGVEPADAEPQVASEHVPPP